MIGPWEVITKKFQMWTVDSSGTEGCIFFKCQSNCWNRSFKIPILFIATRTTVSKAKQKYNHEQKNRQMGKRKIATFSTVKNVWIVEEILWSSISFWNCFFLAFVIKVFITFCFCVSVLISGMDWSSFLLHALHVLTFLEKCTRLQLMLSALTFETAHRGSLDLRVYFEWT